MTTPSHSRTHLTWRWIVFSGQAALFLVVIFQWRSISQLREELLAIRTQPKAESSNPAGPPATTPSTANVDLESWKQVRQEVQQLREEVRKFTERASPAAAFVQPISGEPATPGAAALPSEGDDAQSLVAAVMRGDSRALEELATRVAGSMRMGPEAREAALSGIRSVFGFLGTEAGNGDAAALHAIWRASRIQELEGFATIALGEAAALGNKEALRPLLDPEAYFLLRSSATSALKPAADAGNEQAIQALAATAADPAHQPLWLLVTQGLEGAAAAGNVTAIDSLVRMAANANATIQREAVLALEAAARKNQPRAEEALRRLGWR